MQFLAKSGTPCTRAGHNMCGRAKPSLPLLLIALFSLHGQSDNACQQKRLLSADCVQFICAACGCLRGCPAPPLPRCFPLRLPGRPVRTLPYLNTQDGFPNLKSTSPYASLQCMGSNVQFKLGLPETVLRDLAACVFARYGIESSFIVGYAGICLRSCRMCLCKVWCPFLPFQVGSAGIRPMRPRRMCLCNVWCRLS